MAYTDICEPSVKSLFIEMQFNGQVLSTGTGFVSWGASGNPYLITNRHNVTGRHQHTGELLSKATGAVPNEMAISHNFLGGLGHWIKCVEALYCNERPRWYEHPVLGDKADFVALPLTNKKNVAIYPYDVFKSGMDVLLAPSDTISVVGFPFSLSAGRLYAIWVSGFLASEPDVDYDDLPVMLVDCRSRPGQSGSPVIFFKNGGNITLKNGSIATVTGVVEKFIGIYSGRIHPESDLGMVWKAKAIRELLNTL